MHEIFEEIDQPMPVYQVGDFPPGMFSWMEVNDRLDPYSTSMTFSEMTRVREIWCAIGEEEIHERVLTHEGGFSAILINQFSSAFNDLRNRIGGLESLSDTWTYDDFVNAFAKILIDSFSLAQSVLDDLFEYANTLTTIDSMGLELSDSEKSFLKAIRAMRDNH